MGKNAAQAYYEKYPESHPGEQEQETKRPTREELNAALAVLEADGRASQKDPNSISRGMAVGNALFGLMGATECALVATEALEQWNSHLTVAAIEAIEFKRGAVTREGRDLHIILPDHWGQF